MKGEGEEQQQQQEIEQLSEEQQPQEEPQQQRRQQQYKLPNQRQEIYPVTEGLASPYTASKYRLYFALFLDYIRIHDLEVLLDLGSDAVEALVIKFIKYLRDEKGLSRSTLNSHGSAIRRFALVNGLRLDWDKIKFHYPHDQSTHDDRPYTHDEINRVLSFCDQRSRAIVLLMVSTGIRIGAIPPLQIGDLTKIPQYNLYKVQVYARTRQKYYTFTTPEGAKAIDRYLDYPTCSETDR